MERLPIVVTPAHLHKVTDGQKWKDTVTVVSSDTHTHPLTFSKCDSPPLQTSPYQASVLHVGDCVAAHRLRADARSGTDANPHPHRFDGRSAYGISCLC